MPMHWGTLWADQAEANELTHAIACPISHEPELKACAVQIRVVRSRFKNNNFKDCNEGVGFLKFWVDCFWL
jgi:ferredoxin-nitrate reductase